MSEWIGAVYLALTAALRSTYDVTAVLWQSTFPLKLTVLGHTPLQFRTCECNYASRDFSNNCPVDSQRSPSYCFRTNLKWRGAIACHHSISHGIYHKLISWSETSALILVSHHPLEYCHCYREYFSSPDSKIQISVSHTRTSKSSKSRLRAT